MKFGAIVNVSAGSVPEDAIRLLKEAVAEHGHQVVFPSADSLAPEAQIRQMVREKLDAVIVWGGDGTIATVLTELGGHPMPVLALPGGTMNILPKKLHDGATDWRNVLDAVLSNPAEKWIPAGIAGESRFYVAALFGRLTHLGGSREAIREGNLMEAVNILAREDALALDPELEILTPSKETSSVSAMAAAVLLGEGADAGLEVTAMAPESGLDLAAAAIEAIFTGWRNGADFRAGGLQMLSMCHDSDEAVPATIDGEPCELSCPVEIRYLPRAACMLVAGAQA
ncbi:MAG: diacylglycerol/lipid kinase family protein [Hyphomonas sp.]